MAKQRSLKNIKPLSNFDIEKLIVKLKIPYYIGTFMRDSLMTRRSKPKKFECFVLNMGAESTRGTHWVGVIKFGNVAYYYDSFGKLAPPIELIQYLSPKVQIFYNTKRDQAYNTSVCGHLCVKFLYDFWQSAGNI